LAYFAIVGSFGTDYLAQQAWLQTDSFADDSKWNMTDWAARSAALPPPNWHCFDTDTPADSYFDIVVGNIAVVEETDFEPHEWNRRQVVGDSFAGQDTEGDMSYWGVQGSCFVATSYFGDMIAKEGQEEVAEP